MNPRAYIRELPIRNKLTLLLVVPSVLVLCSCALALLGVQMWSYRHNFERDLVSVTEITAVNIAAAAASGDAESANEILRGLMRKRYVVSARLFLPDQQVLARFGPENAVALATLSITNGVEMHAGLAIVTQPVVLDGEPVATLRVTSDYQQASAGLLSTVIGLIALAAGVVVTVIVVLSRRLQRLVSDPVRHLCDTARRVVLARDYSVRAQELTGAELGLLTRTFNQMLEQIQQQDAALQQASQELSRQVDELRREVTERHQADQKLQELHKELVAASRQAGMAEVATGVLHNVGNVLNSVNVSAELIHDRVQGLQCSGVNRVVALLRQHDDDLGSFLTLDPKGRLVPEFLARLGAHLEEEKEEIRREVVQLNRNIGHIKEIVEMQQNYARMAGMVEDLPVADLIDDALCLNSGAFQRHGVMVRREFHPVGRVRVDKHKVLQILINLLRNAKYALDEANRPDKIITVRIENGVPNRARVVVCDNGVGIPPENLTRIFQHGFTTRSNGHGFGLHSGALAAQEMGGSLHAESEGVGKGATFVLELPAVALKEEHVHGY